MSYSALGRPSAACLAALLLAAAASAAPIIKISSPAAAPGRSSYFDVTLALPASDLGPVVFNGFALDVSIPAGRGVTLTGIDFLEPYVFGANSAQRQLPPPDDVVGTVTATTAHGDDVYFNPLDPIEPGVTLLPGDTFGLFRVTFAVDPSAPFGDLPITLDTTTSEIAFDGGTAAPAAAFGVLQVVPEPPSLLLLGAAAAAWLARRAARRGMKGNVDPE